MTINVLIVHAKDEETLAECLAQPLRDAGYTIAHQGTVLVGESVIEEATKVLKLGGPVILCGTVKAVGSRLTTRLMAVAQSRSRLSAFVVQMDEEADVERFALGGVSALYWKGEVEAKGALLEAVKQYYPLNPDGTAAPQTLDAEKRYRTIALETCDIIDLANLPEGDRNLATRQLELRRLYVALRVNVDVPVGTEADEKSLETLEKRRFARSRSPWEEQEEKNPNKLERVPVGERLAECRRLVVLGDPGAGKTTLLRWMATAYLLRLKHDPDWEAIPDVKTLPDHDWLPILVRCRELNQDCLEGSLEGILRHTMKRAELTEAEASAVLTVLIEKLKAGTALLMLDGLDEITDQGQRIRFCQQIEQIDRAYPNAAIIATSRIVGYREMGHRIGRGFEHVTVADFNREDKDDFAERWCAVTELPDRKQRATTELIQDIHSSDRIERLTGNPMLLTTMALVKRKVGKLPTRRADLYGEAVQVLLNWRREVDEPLDYREASPQLEYIAYAMCALGIQQLREDEILELLERVREEYPRLHDLRNHTPLEFLRLLERRTGILLEAGRERHLGEMVSVFEFRHLTIQEFLAARALISGRFPNRKPSENLAQYIAPLAGQTREVRIGRDNHVLEKGVSENWREALRLCVASYDQDDVDDVLLAILNPFEGEDAPTARARAIMAVLCLADEPNVSEQTAETVLQQFVQYVGPDDGQGFCRTGIDTAAVELGSSRWANLLQTLLVQEFCRQAPKNRWNSGGLAGMVGAVSLSKDEAEIAVWLEQKVLHLQSVCEPEVITAALEIMQLSYEEKIFVIPDLAEKLLAILPGKPPSAHASTWALFWLKNKRRLEKAWRPSRDEVGQLISFINDPTFDSQAARYLIFIIKPEGDARSVKPLIARLEDEDNDVRRMAAQVLGELGDTRAVEPLIARLEDEDNDVRQAAVQALIKLGDTRAVEPLIARLEDEDNDVRRMAAQVLGELGDTRAVKPLIARLEDEDNEVRQAAAQVLGELGDSRAVEPLIARLEDEDNDVRRMAAQVLGELGDTRAVEPLIARLEDEDNDVRQAAVQALIKLGDTRAVEPLIARLEDEDNDVRRMAAQVLGELGDTRAVEPLIARLGDQDSDVRREAAQVLGQLGDVRAVEPLIARLGDRDSDVRRAAAEALGKLGDARAVEPLIARLEHEDGNVRREAAQVLGQLGDVRAVEPLIARLGDQDSDVRRAAAEALGKLGDARAVEPFIARLEDEDRNVRREAAQVLGQLGDARAVAILMGRLTANDPETRCEALRGLSYTCDETTDRKLLSRDLDAVAPFLDPLEPITDTWIHHAAQQLRLSVEEVYQGYEALALKFNLILDIPQRRSTDPS